jgi:hypothetical protein
MNLNNWKNWGTNLLIRFGLQDPYYAHGFVESDSVIENTEEDSLIKTFFELRIGKNWYKPWKWGGERKSGNTPKGPDIQAAVDAATKKANEAANKAAADAAAKQTALQKQVDAMKAAQEARRGKIATASASQLAIGPQAQDRVGALRKKKESRRMGTQQTRKTRKPTVIAPGTATGGGGAYGGAPVV